MSDRFIAGPWVAIGSTVYSERDGEPCPVCTTDGFVERFKSDEIPCEQLAQLISAAPDMLKALEELECYDCQHLMKYHVDKYGCEVERGDQEGFEGEPAYAMGPCGCQCLDTPDLLNLIAAIRKARGL